MVDHVYQIAIRSEVALFYNLDISGVLKLASMLFPPTLALEVAAVMKATLLSSNCYSRSHNDVCE